MKVPEVKKIDIKSREYKIVDWQDDMVLTTENLQDDIACTLFSLDLKKVALGRNLSKDQIKQLFAEMNNKHTRKEGLIEMHIIGGDNSETTQARSKELLETLQQIDNNQNIINIKSFDVGERFHPESFQISCYHGGVSAL